MFIHGLTFDVINYAAYYYPMWHFNPREVKMPQHPHIKALPLSQSSAFQNKANDGFGKFLSKALAKCSGP